MNTFCFLFVVDVTDFGWPENCDNIEWIREDKIFDVQEWIKDWQEKDIVDDKCQYGVDQK